MTKFALGACSTRKLRTALTAIAIVLGVAMVSGTFVLTDSIDKAFDAIFTDVYKGTDARSPGKSPFDLEDGSGSTDAAVRRVAAREVQRAARRRRARSAASRARRAARQGRRGDRLRRCAEPRLQRRPGEGRSSRADARRGCLAEARTRSSSTGRRRTRRTSSRGRDRRAGRRPGRDAADLRPS